MHVLIIVSWYKTESNPVAGSFFEEQARALQKFGCTVGLLHIGFKKFSDRQARLDRTFDDRGLFTMQYESRALLPKKENINYLYLCKRAYKKYQKYSKVMGKPDIIHAHSVFWGGIAARYISQKTNIPYIITEHLTNFILGKINSKTDIDYAKKVFSDSSANIAVSSSFKKELSEKLNLNEGKCLVVHNLVSSIFFQNRVQKVIREIEPIRFFTNSFISERKNILLLIESFSIFCKIYPQSQLIIGGDVVREFDTGYKERLLERVESLNIKEKIFFLGPLSREQVKSEIDQCHVFLLGSQYETFGVALIEALACGRPVISTDSKGPQDIVDASNGILVNSFSAEDYACAMEKVIGNYQNYNQDQISADCFNKFGEVTIIGRLKAIYEQCLISKVGMRE